jgi:hypothetical protein
LLLFLVLIRWRPRFCAPSGAITRTSHSSGCSPAWDWKTRTARYPKSTG